MSKKSTIRGQAAEALVAMNAASRLSADDPRGDALMTHALVRLAEAAGVPNASRRVTEAAAPTTPGAGDLLARMGLDETDRALLREAGGAAGAPAPVADGRQDGSATKTTRDLPVPGSVDELRRMIDEAGSNPPDDVRDHLAQHAHSLGQPDLVAHWNGVREAASLREAIAFASNVDGATNPRRREGGLLDRMGIDRDELI